jgi:hypothetical protein
MPAVIYASTGESELTALVETEFLKEAQLQNFLSKNPALLAGDQMTPADPRRFLLVTAEAGIPIAEGTGNYFSLDHLFIDQDGIPTLVEVKRSSDTRARREVIGQMLEYAANVCAFWSVDSIRCSFETRCQRERLTAEAELRRLTEAESDDPNSIWDLVSTNLKQQRLRLVFVADKFSPETQRIIEFLDKQVETTEVYAVEVAQFTGGGIRTLVPRVLNPSVLRADRRAIASGKNELWTADRFYEDLRKRHGDKATTIFRDLAEWAEAEPGLTISFGRGKLDGSIRILADGIPIVTLWTSGGVEIDFEYLVKTSVFVTDENREELRNRLMANSSLQIPIERIRMRPQIEWSQLSDSTNMNALRDSIAWAAHEINSSIQK